AFFVTFSAVLLEAFLEVFFETFRALAIGLSFSRHLASRSASVVKESYWAKLAHNTNDGGMHRARFGAIGVRTASQRYGRDRNALHGRASIDKVATPRASCDLPSARFPPTRSWMTVACSKLSRASHCIGLALLVAACGGDSPSLTESLAAQQ